MNADDHDSHHDSDVATALDDAFTHRRVPPVRFDLATVKDRGRRRRTRARLATTVGGLAVVVGVGVAVLGDHLPWQDRSTSTTPALPPVGAVTTAPTGWRIEGPLVISAGSSQVTANALIAGDLRYDGRCLTLGGYPVVWPGGTTWDAASTSVVLPDGTHAPLGTTVTGGGGYHRASGLPYSGDDRIGTLLEDCAGPAGEVAVFNPGSSPTTDPDPSRNPPGTALTSAPEVSVTYQDGTSVTWAGPARGGAWITDAARVDELPADPGTAQGRELSTWDRQVRDTTFGGGGNEELGMQLGPDGQVSYARSTGIFDSFVWAPGPQLAWLEMDPCSHWPASSALQQPPAGVTCRVLSIDGHPVVAAEGDGSSTVFTVRADGIAVQIQERSADGEPVRSGEELAAAALALDMRGHDVTTSRGA